MAAKRILLLAGDYAEDYETMVPFQTLLTVGHVVHAVDAGAMAGGQGRGGLGGVAAVGLVGSQKGLEEALAGEPSQHRPALLLADAFSGR